MKTELEHCRLCPHRCGVNRLAGELGYCRAGALAKVALVSLHKWEEPCLTGKLGAGTVFFSYCNLRCVFCQNHEISQQGKGKEVSAERLAGIFIEQQQRGASTLDLVTPTHYVPQILAALEIAKEKGLQLPVVYNSNAYETVETIDLLRGYVDIFLPDLKYREEASALRYSAAPGYFAAAAVAIRRMLAIAGPPVFREGILQQGVLVRHLILPGKMKESMQVVRWLWENFGNQVYLSLMNQFTPLYQTAEYPEINRRLTTYEYQKVIDYARELGVEQCFIQQGRTASKEFVPDFSGAGL